MKKVVYWSTEIRSELEEALASQMHDIWRTSVKGKQDRPDRDLDGNKIPGTSTDINVPFSQLTPGWQAYNSVLAIKYIEGFRDSMYTKDIEILSYLIHEIWMANNEWDKANKPELFVSYSKLPEVEKDKDRALADFIIQYYFYVICDRIDTYFAEMEMEGFNMDNQRKNVELIIEY